MASEVVFKWQEPVSQLKQRSFIKRRFGPRIAEIIGWLLSFFYILLIIFLLREKAYLTAFLLVVIGVGDFPFAIPKTYRITEDGVSLREWMFPYLFRWNEIEIYRVYLPLEQEKSGNIEFKIKRKNMRRWISFPFDADAVDTEDLARFLERKLPNKKV
jgi:hypothetical protein